MRFGTWLIVVCVCGAVGGLLVVGVIKLLGIE